MTPDKNIALSEVQKAKVILVAKQHHLSRLEQLFEQGACSEDRIEDARLEVEVAKLDLSIAESKLNKLP